MRIGSIIASSVQIKYKDNKKNAGVSQPSLSKEKMDYNPMIFRNQMISFQAAKPDDAKAAVKKFLEDVAIPFLEENADFIKTNRKIHDGADAITEPYFEKLFGFQRKLGFNWGKPAEVQGFENDLAKPIVYRKNIVAFNNLKTKAKNLWIDDIEEVQVAIANAGHIVHTPNKVLQSYDLYYGKYNKMIKSLNKKLSSIPKDIANSELLAKQEKIREASSIGLFNMHFTNTVSLFKTNAKKFLADERTFNNDAYEYINEVREAIKKHKEYLPEMQERMSKAQKLIEQNSFTPKDVDDAFEPLEEQYQKVIESETAHLRGFAERRPNLRWDNKNNVEVDAVLDAQQNANKTLKAFLHQVHDERYVATNTNFYAANNNNFDGVVF